MTKRNVVANITHDEMFKYVWEVALARLVALGCPISKDHDLFSDLNFLTRPAPDGFNVECDGDIMSDTCSRCRFLRR